MALVAGGIQAGAGIEHAFGVFLFGGFSEADRGVRRGPNHDICAMGFGT